MSNKNSTDANALLNRSQVNKNSTNDFDTWSINHFPRIRFGSTVLDLGCGLGKQLRLFSHIHKHSSFIGTDISQDALNNIRSEISTENVQLIHTSFDDVEAIKLNWENKADLAYSFYAYYYANDLYRFTNEIYKSLRDKGILWVVSPTKGTNMELFSIIAEFYEIPEKVTLSITEFSENLKDIAVQVGFKAYEVNLFNNQIIFEEATTLINYYRNTTFYDKSFAEDVESKIKSHFLAKDVFYLSKNAISLKFYK